jgi:hypothetical protein
MSSEANVDCVVSMIALLVVEKVQGNSLELSPLND